MTTVKVIIWLESDKLMTTEDGCNEGSRVFEISRVPAIGEEVYVGYFKNRKVTSVRHHDRSEKFEGKEIDAVIWIE